MLEYWSAGVLECWYKQLPTQQCFTAGRRPSGNVAQASRLCSPLSFLPLYEQTQAGRPCHFLRLLRSRTIEEVLVSFLVISCYGCWTSKDKSIPNTPRQFYTYCPISYTKVSFNAERIGVVECWSAGVVVWGREYNEACGGREAAEKTLWSLSESSVYDALRKMVRSEPFFTKPSAANGFPKKVFRPLHNKCEMSNLPASAAGSNTSSSAPQPRSSGSEVARLRNLCSHILTVE